MLEKAAIYLDPYFKKKIANKIEMRNFFSKKIIKRYLKPYIFLKIKKRIKYVYDNSQFYNKLFKESNLKPSDIKTYQDISKIPFTTSLDILDSERFFCVPKNKFVKSFKSSGTTGKPKITYLTENDVKEQIQRNKIGLKLIYGINQNDTVRILNPPRYSIFFCTYHALKDIGAKINYLKERLSPEKEYKILKQKNVSAIIGDPFFFYSISSEMSLKYDLADLNVRTVLLGSEPLPESIRKRLEEIWDADVFNVYGINEVGISIAGECEEKNGMHITGTDFYVEVINPKSDKKLEDGTKGELVFTTINKEGMPLIRYRTKDFGYIVPGECKCGFPFERIKIQSRMDDMILIGFAECLYPAEISEAIFSVPSILDYQIILNRDKSMDSLKIIVESTQIDNKKQVSDLIKNALMRVGQIKTAVQDSKNVEIKEIKVVKPKSIYNIGHKKTRIIDNRKIYDCD